MAQTPAKGQATVLREDESQYVEEDWGSLRWVASRALGNANDITVGHVVIRQGRSNPLHSHSNCEEALYLLRGRLDHVFGSDHAILEAGDTLVIAPGVAHRATSIGDVDAEMIVVYSSGERVMHEED